MSHSQITGIFRVLFLIQRLLECKYSCQSEWFCKNLNWAYYINNHCNIGQPDDFDRNEDCTVVLTHDEDIGLLNDIPCTDDRVKGYICKYKLGKYTGPCFKLWNIKLYVMFVVQLVCRCNTVIIKLNILTAIMPL